MNKGKKKWIKKQLLFSVILLSFSVCELFADSSNKVSRINIVADKKVPIYSVNEPIVFSVSMLGVDDKPALGRKLTYHIRRDGAPDMKGTFQVTDTPHKLKTSLPAIVYFHGAGVRSARVQKKAGCMTFDINAHGVPNGRGKDFYQKLKKEGVGFVHKGKDSREKSYLRGMFLRAFMALRYVKSRPEWNGRVLVAYGHSQGGGQALIAGGLDSDVTLVVAREPAFCDHHGYLKKQACGWPNLTNNGKYTPRKVVENIGYFDAVNFASNIKGEVLMIAGFGDYICPPTGVYAAYNVISVKKRIIDDYRGGHWATPESSRLVWPVVDEHINKYSAGKK